MDSIGGETSGFKKQDPIFYAGAELHAVKRQKIQDAIAHSGFDALLLFKAEAVRYVTDFYVKGFRPFMEPEYFTLIPKGVAPAVGYTSGSDDLRIIYKSDIEDARKLPSVSKWADVLSQMIVDYGLQEAVIGTDFVPFMVYADLCKKFPKIQWVDAADIWVDITAVKHDLEVELIRNSVRVADLGMLAAIRAVKPGVAEYEVAAEAEYVMRKNGSEFVPFIPNVASGYNTSMFERLATEKVIESGELVILDVGCVVKGYTGDLGRTVICGEPTPLQKEIYAVVYDSVMEACKMVKPGVTCAEVDARSREVIEDAGWGKYQHTGITGHQLGYGLHGAPEIFKGIDVPLQKNMVICLEPRVILRDRPDVGGVHLENAVLVTDDGFEFLNNTPYDPQLRG